MKAFSKKWKLGVGKSVAWPVGIGNKGNAGVAGNIRTTLGAIGYVNQSYIKGEIRAAELQNKNGDFVAPTVESGALALNGITLDENLAGTNPNPAAEGAYPIATLTWVLAYETGNGNKTEAIKTTLSTLLSDEYQEKASVLGYVPLRGDILQKSRAAVDRIGK
jgi:phosphate transport system substrate-binding protein